MDLPDDLPLPLRSGEPYWYWLGGRPALDLVNTLRERWWRNVETLTSATDLARWLAAAELLPAGCRVRASRDQLASARALREAIDVGVRAVVEGRPVPGASVATIDALMPLAALLERLRRGPAGVPVLETAAPGDPVGHALGLVARDGALLLGTVERERARICASDTCSARFYDRSPTAARRWCSMRGCGNVEKARRHRARAGRPV